MSNLRVRVEVRDNKECLPRTLHEDDRKALIQVEASLSIVVESNLSDDLYGRIAFPILTAGQ